MRTLIEHNLLALIVLAIGLFVVLSLFMSVADLNNILQAMRIGVCGAMIWVFAPLMRPLFQRRALSGRHYLGSGVVLSGIGLLLPSAYIILYGVQQFAQQGTFRLTAAFVALIGLILILVSPVIPSQFSTRPHLQAVSVWIGLGVGAVVAGLVLTIGPLLAV